MEGLSRGLYKNSTLEIIPGCFGEDYLTKANILYAMWLDNPLRNFIPMASLVYQFYYMLGNQCSVDKIMNDLAVFCWN